VGHNPDLTWLLLPGEREADLLKFEYQQSEIKDLYMNHFTRIDPLYLVKWCNLSY